MIEQGGRVSIYESRRLVGMLYPSHEHANKWYWCVTWEFPRRHLNGYADTRKDALDTLLDALAP